MSGFRGVLAAEGSNNVGPLSGTMTTSVTLQANQAGYSNGSTGTPAAGGVMTAVTFPSGATLTALWDNQATNKFNLQISDPTLQLQQTAFTQIVMNSITFTTATATFFASAGGSAEWQWSDSGVPVAGSGRTYAIT